MAEEDRCALCGGPGLANDQVDHIRERAQGGTNERTNLRRTHKRCNASRRK